MNIRLMVCVWLLFAWISSNAVAGVNEDLLVAAREGKASVIERLLKEGANAAVKDARGATPLHWAVGIGNQRAVELLLANRADAKARDRDGYTPLHMAAYWKHAEIAQTLLAHGADADAVSTSGYTPLFKAAEPITPCFAENTCGEMIPVPEPEDAVRVSSLVRILLSKGAKANSRLKDGTTPLHMAVTLGVTDVVRQLLVAGVDVDVQNVRGVTPLFMAARLDRSDIATLLLSHGANPEAVTDNGSTPLVIASGNGNAQMVELLLNKGANPKRKDKVGVPLLQRVLEIESRFYDLSSPSPLRKYSPQQKEELLQARKMVKGEWRKVARLLVQYGADANGVDVESAPLYVAATLGDRELVELLLDKGARIGGEDFCETPLHSAIAEQHADVAAVLVRRGANVNALNRSKRTPLHFLGTSLQDAQLAKLMLDKGADPNARDKSGETPVDFAVQAGNMAVLTVLKQRGGTPSGKPPQPVTLDEIKSMLDVGMSADELLSTAARKGELRSVEFLLTRGANVNANTGEAGLSPLLSALSVPYTLSPMALSAARTGRVRINGDQLAMMKVMRGEWREVALLLIRKGADIKASVPSNGLSALHLAAAAGYQDVVEALLGKGVNKDGKAAQSANMSPLHMAIANGQTTIVKLLISQQADVRARMDGGYTALHLAATVEDEYGALHGIPELAELLIDRGVSVNVKADNGMTPLHLSASINDVAMSKLLVSKGAEVNVKDAQSHTPLYYGKLNGSAEVVKFLGAQGGE